MRQKGVNYLMKPCVVKQYITEALFRLMKEKDYRTIHISELVQTAGVCRASFYRNYLTMEDIVDEYYKAAFDDIYSKYPMEEHNIRYVVKQIFCEIKARKREFELLNRQGLLGRMDKYIYEGTLSQINKLNVLNNRYQPHFFAGASFALIKAWIAYGFEESEEEMTQIFFRSLQGYL